MAEIIPKWYWWWRARFLRALDGDTIEVEIDNGFGSRQVEKVRVADVNCPERHQEGGHVARAFTHVWMVRSHESWLVDGGRDDFHLLICTFPASKNRPGQQKRTFIRYVAEVYSWDLTSLSESIIRAGHGES